MILTKKILAYQVSNNYYNETHCSFDWFRKFSRVYFVRFIINLRKRQVLFKKPTLEKKAILSVQETWELSPFLGRFKVPLIYTCSL